MEEDPVIKQELKWMGLQVNEAMNTLYKIYEKCEQHKEFKEFPGEEVSKILEKLSQLKIKFDSL